MPKPKDPEQLTPREMEIMCVLWNSTEPLHASQISAQSNLSLNTVNAVVKKLLGRNIIKIADITHSGTVLARRYKSCISHDKYMTGSFVSQLDKMQNKLPTPQVMTALLEQEPDELLMISTLEKILEERKKKLSGGN